MLKSKLYRGFLCFFFFASGNKHVNFSQVANVLLMIRRKFIHNSPYTHTHTHTLTHIRTIFAAVSLTVAASLPGGFHVQLVLLEWSAAAATAEVATASARRQRWQRAAFITVCAFWVFFFSFLLPCVFFFTLFSICLCPITVAIYSSGSKACKQRQEQQQQKQQQQSSHQKGDQLRREAATAAAPAFRLLLSSFAY